MTVADMDPVEPRVTTRFAISFPGGSLAFRCGLMICVLLLSMLFVWPAKADITPPNPDGPTIVTVDMWIDDINDINLSSGTFDLTAQFGMRWNDPRLAFDSEVDRPRIWMSSRAEQQLKSIWYPVLDVSGEKGLSSARVYWLAVWPNGDVEIREKFTAHPRFDGELHYFPFGSLDLSLALSSAAMDSRQVMFELGELTPKDDLKAVDRILHGNWYPTNVNWSVSSQPGFSHSKRSFAQIDLNILVNYDAHDGIQKILLPLIVIALVSWGLLWIDLTFQAAYTSPRIGGTTTLILTTIALKFVLNRELPVVHYFTLSDVLFNTTIIMLSVSLLASCLIVGLLVDGKPEPAKRINLLVRRYYAVVYVLLLLVSIPLFVG